MGQAFRRATGRINSAKVETTPPKLRKPIEQRQPPENLTSENVGPTAESLPKVKPENVLEDRDPKFDAMLNRMVGRIQTKPGGKHEMGEAFVVENYRRPLPKLRNTTTDSGRYEERPAPPGTLNVSQLRHIMLLYQGKADDHKGRMNITEISNRFHIDSTEVERILQFVSLPPEDEKSLPKVKPENVLEDRDPKFDAMLNRMVGRIQTKPGGKHEMGEAFVVENYRRPLPKLRNTTTDSGRYEERPAPPGTLNVSQLRHIMLLYQGKADDHKGRMNITEISNRFHIDSTEVERILQFVSLPPEDESKKKADEH